MKLNNKKYLILRFLSSCGGKKNQTFNFTILPEEIWIRKSPKESLFCRWDQVKDFKEVNGDEKVYKIDTESGKIIFGDGKNGAIPPMGVKNILAIYRSGVGSIGGIGIPEINAGDTIILLGLGKKFSKLYFIEKSTHSIDSEGYEIRFNIE